MPLLCSHTVRTFRLWKAMRPAAARAGWSWLDRIARIIFCRAQDVAPNRISPCVRNTYFADSSRLPLLSRRDHRHYLLRPNDCSALADVHRPFNGGIRPTCLRPATVQCGREIKVNQKCALSRRCHSAALTPPRLHVHPRMKAAHHALRKGVVVMLTLRPLRFNCRLFRARLVGFILACLGAIMSPASASAQTVLHVAQAAASGGNGSSWGTAFTHPQQALNAAAAIGGSVLIKVAQGTYVPTLRTDAGDPRSVTFRLRNNTTLSGGYAGPGAADPDARDVALYETILSGDINGDDLPNFVNYGDNASHVLIGSGTDATAVLDGFTVSGGNAPGADVGFGGGGLMIVTGSPTIRSCWFARNRAAGSGGAIRNHRNSAPFITQCRFTENAADFGSAIGSYLACSPNISSCEFYFNKATSRGTVAQQGYEDDWHAGELTINSCIFAGNTAIAGAAILFTTDIDYESNRIDVTDSIFLNNVAELGGGAIAAAGSLTVERSSFHDNSSGYIGGAITSIGPCTIVDSQFIGNHSNLMGGAIVCDASVFRNCVVSANMAQVGAGIVVDRNTTIDNCSVASNEGSGIHVLNESLESGPVLITNSIVWGNSLEQIVIGEGNPPPPPGLTDVVTVSFSNIQGGWTGAGSNNINQDPLFIQTSCGNLRLSHDSPCIDAGSNALIPAGVNTDLAGNPRIQNGIVDMGAYEGGHDMMPAAACADYLAQGVTVRLVPNGGEFSPLYNPGIVIRNTSDPDMGNAMVTQSDFPLHPTAGGFNELGSALTVTTSIPNGQFWMRVVIPFTAENLNGFAPEDVELTFFDESANKWKLAASANVANSPGHSGPLGDRLFTQGTTSQFGLSPDLGDYGVFWNPQLQQGFAWANVDHATDFAIGIPLPQCSGDCQYPGNALVNIGDLQTVVEAWGAVQSGPLSFADITRDGGVNVPDLLAVMNGWGPCR